ncbi:E-3 epididymal fluid protein [Rattus norvegicus]|uniref:Beta-defensin n=2 Tax=Rattus norvegicus TaxID=10116 RepID=Q99JD1_RAT|nr:beta-defensin 126 precursor [Rattus norvegicus]AAK38836.1 E-3 epididymal fluid protein [Rattus norvegicus]AAT51892.1 beta-defensin 22 [Rattus norvegicus]EDL86066.1 E-3 epididymal fluid protein [Rattus norvegicus]CAC36191.1 2D6 glycoprotein [Rattus norvegicus]|eukprot:NP_599218.1 beta-defensin 126 precursor [Rattus norvegicus]
MKSLLSALMIIMFLAHLVTGNWYVRKCANKLGTCRKTCRKGEYQTDPATGKCSIGKLCCILDLKLAGQCGGADGNQAAAGTQAAGGTRAAGGTQGTGGTGATGAAATTAAP